MIGRARRERAYQRAVSEHLAVLEAAAFRAANRAANLEAGLVAPADRDVWGDAR